MTREEAIRRMECCRNFLVNNYSDMGEPNVTAFNMAIKALSQEPKDDATLKDIFCMGCEYKEQEPCEDAISRQAVNTLIDELARAISDERCCIPRGRSTATIMQDILDLPPVNPQEPKTGYREYNDIYDHYLCGNCKTVVMDYDNFCPNCGARMVESQETKQPEISSYYGLKSYVRERSE